MGIRSEVQIEPDTAAESRKRHHLLESRYWYSEIRQKGRKGGSSPARGGGVQSAFRRGDILRIVYKLVFAGIGRIFRAIMHFEI